LIFNTIYDFLQSLLVDYMKIKNIELYSLTGFLQKKVFGFFLF
jgi:hypothetical protein